VVMTTPLLSAQMKSAMMSDLILFKALLILVIQKLESFMKLTEFSIFIGTITCFLDGPFVVMFSFDFSLFSLLIIFCFGDLEMLP